jgi:iron(III) transport system permease protein
MMMRLEWKYPYFHPARNHSDGALVFLAVMKELSIGLMLAPNGFYTLSYRVWSAYQEAIFSQIAVPGLILMIISLVSIHLFLRGENHRESIL